MTSISQSAIVVTKRVRPHMLPSYSPNTISSSTAGSTCLKRHSDGCYTTVPSASLSRCQYSTALSFRPLRASYNNSTPRAVCCSQPPRQEFGKQPHCGRRLSDPDHSWARRQSRVCGRSSRTRNRCRRGTAHPDAIDAKEVTDRLVFSEEPDLVIKTGAERLSDFAIWQSVYSELYFIDVNWRDFRRRDYLRAVLDFQDRQRRFGR